MGERRGTKGLELWCRKMTEGYPGVKIDNMTTSWRDGLAFCAIIHHFRPDLIDFDKLNKANIYENNELAFTVAEHHLGIPALLEPEDMVEYEVPDRLSILTYLSQFYQTFESHRAKSGARAAPKRPQTTPDHGIVSPESTSPPSKVQITIGKSRREPCAKCGLPVFIAERLNVGKLLYHRTCFRCARCKSQLSLANYYETEKGEFCCEICPDEERAISKKVIPDSVLNRSLSDEEKTANLQSYTDAPDAYSTHFETALEYTLDVDLKKSSTLTGAVGSGFTKARSSFFQSQLDSSSESEVETPPPVKPKPPLSPKPNLEILLRTNPRISSDNNSFPVSRTKNNSDNHSVSVSEQTNDRFVTKDNPSSPTGMSVRARMKLFENDKEDKSDVNNSSRSSNESPLVTKKAAVITIDDLEDFDNISNKNNFDLEALEESTEAHSVIDEEEPSSTAKNKIIDEEENHQSSNSFISEVITINDSRESVEPPETTHITISDRDIVKADESHITISDISSDIVKQADGSHITISDISSDIVKQADDSHITEEESPVENTNLSKQTQDSFLSVKSNFSCTTESSGDVPTRGYYTAYEIPTTVSEDAERKDPEDALSPPKEIQTADKDPEYPDELNPFDEEEAPKPTEIPPTPGVRTKKKLIPVETKQVDTPTSQLSVHRISKNPFEDEDLSDEETAPSSSYNPFDDEEDGKQEEKIVPKPRKTIIPAFVETPLKGYNPFEEDEDEPEVEVRQVPVPTPRLSKASRPEPKPRDTLSVTSRGSHGGSTSSISSGSAFGSARKKKPAPRPPVPFGSPEYPDSLVSSPPSSMSYSSPNLSGTIRSRKNKRAPPPPKVSTPFSTNQMDGSTGLACAVSPIMSSEQLVSAKLEKNLKNEENKTRKQLDEDKNLEDDNLPHPNKSAAGRWKRNKGKAPSRPIPERRIVKSLPLSEIKRELDTIEIQQQGLEKQGVRLEQIIREKCEGPETAASEETVPIDVEDMILQLFELVNEKNELFRRQTELMYLRRQQRLEEEYADVEYQIRCMLLEPDSNKSDYDKLKEEILVSRLVEIVERRNEIVECLEMDRKREAEEDNSISSQLNLYAAKRDGDRDSSREEEKKDKKKKLKKLNKLIGTFKHKKEKDRKTDADKDVDESETGTNLDKGKKKLKWPL